MSDRQLARRVADRFLARRVADRFIRKLADQPPGQPKHVRDMVTPINPPKGVSPGITKDYAESKSTGEDTALPHARDVQPKDVFKPVPRDVGALNLVETGKDLSQALDRQVPKDKGHETVDNLSQYLVRTEGGGEGGPEGKKP